MSNGGENAMLPRHLLNTSNGSVKLPRLQYMVTELSSFPLFIIVSYFGHADISMSFNMSAIRILLQKPKRTENFTTTPCC